MPGRSSCSASAARLLGIKAFSARLVEGLSSAGGDVSSMVGAGAGFGLGAFLVPLPLLGMMRRATQGESVGSMALRTDKLL